MEAVTSEGERLEREAIEAYLAGLDEVAASSFERAHGAFLVDGAPEHAARCAFWLGLTLLLQNGQARASGWLARAARAADAAPTPCPTQGLLLVPEVLACLDDDAGRARALADQIIELGRRCEDSDVLALGHLCAGEATIALGDAVGGTRLLDEAMLLVSAGSVSPIATGIVYCAVIELCVVVLDVRRAAEWTEALRSWCDGPPERVPYRGLCLVHRSQVLQARGDWGSAAVEAERARELLQRREHAAVGEAFYQIGELHRLRGSRVDAERAYRDASDHGRPPEPGLALLRAAEGNVDAARASVRRMLSERTDDPVRPTLLAAAVDVLLCCGDVEGAETAAAELSALAAERDIPFVRASASFAAGRVRLTRGDHPAALHDLRQAVAVWLDLDVPYDAARARVELARVLRSLGDVDGAELELEAAARCFERLGAVTDLSRVQAFAGGASASPLTGREVEVLRHVANGETNRDIATAMGISEHTVARHVQNTFAKLGVSTRAAATAYGYEHHLL